MTKTKAAALISIAHARADLKRRVLAAHAAGDLGNGAWLTLVRDEMAKIAMSASEGER